MTSVISVEGVSKRYRLGAIGGRTLREDVSRAWARLRRKPDPFLTIGQEDRSATSGSIWALRDVSFEVRQGEALGIIGRNGAGKSTLLKILSRITAPTAGQVKLRGRVASLLEVGTGFHPELTGRDNVLLNGALLGMRRREILGKMDEIVAFAEIERFADTPVKRYSSGMYVRLAFAVAAHLDPEILIVDEVLAVGDAAFQRKSLGKMGEVTRGGGRTVLFVSHNMTAVRSVCSRGILLEKGTTAVSGPMSEVADSYLRANAKETTEREWGEASAAPGTDAFRIKSIKLLPCEGEGRSLIDVATPFDIVSELWSLRPGTVNMTLDVRLPSGETVFAVGSPTMDLSTDVVARFACRFPGGLLNDQTYVVNLLIVEDARVHFCFEEALVFQTQEVARTGHWLGKWPGVLRPQLEWTCEKAQKE